jgi:hypothetical protein
MPRVLLGKELSVVNENELSDYLHELREQVCKRCIVRLPEAPPCDIRGVGCGIEGHLPKLIELCRTVDSRRIDPYVERLLTDICANCEFRETSVCPCPLKYLLPLAVQAVETVEFRRSGAPSPAHDAALERDVPA